MPDLFRLYKRKRGGQYGSCAGAQCCGQLLDVVVYHTQIVIRSWPCPRLMGHTHDPCSGPLGDKLGKARIKIRVCQDHFDPLCAHQLDQRFCRKFSLALKLGYDRSLISSGRRHE